MRLYCSDFERFPPTAGAVCAVTFLIALVSCKDRNTGSHSPQPSVSIATITPQAMPVMTPYPPNTTYKPPKGYVPDAATAIKIAEAVWILIYGEETLKGQLLHLNARYRWSLRFQVSYSRPEETSENGLLRAHLTVGFERTQCGPQLPAYSRLRWSGT